MSFIPTAKGLVYNMDLFVTQPPVNYSLTNHWITRIMALMQLLSICYQKTIESDANPHKHWVFTILQLTRTPRRIN